MSIQITQVTEENRPTALRLLFARFPVDEQETRLKDALRSAERGQLNLTGLLLAQENGQPAGAALIMHQADGVTLVWPPVVTCQTTEPQSVEDELMARVCHDIDGANSKMAQVLLDPDDSVEKTLLGRHGFEHVADMFFIARTLSPSDLSPLPMTSELEHELFHEANADRFSAVIERTYQKSLDCPFLDGLRNGKDALVSHRLSGSFDPTGWHIYRYGSEDVGVLLMNEHPDQDAIELVYFGIVPEFRGRGLGRQVLQKAIFAAAQKKRAAMFLAVDCENSYANSLYSELKFAELARRSIMIRRSL